MIQGDLDKNNLKMLKKSPKQWFYLIYFWVLGIIAVHFILNLGLSFTNDSGCYRAYTASSGTLSDPVKKYYDSYQAQCQVLSS